MNILSKELQKIIDGNGSLIDFKKKLEAIENNKYYLIKEGIDTETSKVLIHSLNKYSVGIKLGCTIFSSVHFE